LAVASDAHAEDVVELGQNTAINVAGIPILAYLWRRDLADKDRRLARIKAGGALASLQVKVIDAEGTPMLAKLSDFRRNRGMSRRIVIVSAAKELLRSSLKRAVEEGANVAGADILIVPLEIVQGDKNNAEDFGLHTISLEDALEVESEDAAKVRHIATPVVVPNWESTESWSLPSSSLLRRCPKV